MDHQIKEQPEESLFQGRSAAKAMGHVLRDHGKRLGHRPLTELSRFDFNADVEAMHDALADALSMTPLSSEVGCLVLRLNEDADPPHITIHGADRFITITDEPFIFPPRGVVVGQITPEFFLETQRLLEELDFNPNGELAEIREDESPEQAEFYRREAIFDLLERPLNLRFMAAAISHICRRMDADFLLDNVDELQIAVMGHMGDPFLVGRLTPRGWIPSRED
ncbi:hypothetical protein JXA47_13190 [Candidatus Sumerlaeota bacterium]|nr:hypothetical protein [Candidatus Sumerlaeota bacterium]